MNLEYLEEIGYNPIARKLQNEAQMLGAKYNVISNGENHMWLKTGEGGRPEHSIEIKYENFNSKTLSENKYAEAIHLHVAEFLRNFPITDDHIFDVSLVLYLKFYLEVNGSRKGRYNIHDFLFNIKVNIKDFDASVQAISDIMDPEKETLSRAARNEPFIYP